MLLRQVILEADRPGGGVRQGWGGGSRGSGLRVQNKGSGLGLGLGVWDFYY